MNSLQQQINILNQNPKMRLKGLEFDLKQAEEQVRMCNESIVNGDWNGYSENLVVRKEAFKRYKNTVEEIKMKINSI